jgi:uncharacterized membrane protein
MSNQRDEKEMKGCLIGFGVLFIIQSVYISLTLVFGGNIYKTKYTSEGDEYTDVGNLRTMFIIMFISLVIYLFYYWINKKNK